MYFSTDGLRKTWIDKFLKSPISQALVTRKMVKRAKHYPKLNDSTFTIFLDPCESNKG